MSESEFQDLSLAAWRGTRDTLQGYSRLLGAIRLSSSPRQRQWAHVTLRVVPEGFITTPMPSDRGTFGLRLDLVHNKLRILTSAGQSLGLRLEGQSLASLYSEVMTALKGLEVPLQIDAQQFSDDSRGEWDLEAIGRYRRAVAEIDAAFKVFKGEHRQETSPVQLFPHHFDLALSWFSGRQVPDQDPSNEEWSDEQMTFGFLTGDEAIAEPYFYATAYPEPKGYVGSDLPERAYWNEAGFSGAVLPYSALVQADQPVRLLSEFLRQAHKAGASRMSG
ncbi:MAG: DUF5996 family protein [Thermoanaerobaculia bacterium]